MTSPLAQLGSLAAQPALPITVNDEDYVEIRDFTIAKKFIAFRIDEDVFHAYAIMGGVLMQELMTAGDKLHSAMVSEVDGRKVVDLEPVAKIFDALLEPDSVARFRERLFAADETALDIKRQLMPIIYMLLEEFGLRPTQPSSDSSAGSPSGTDGTPSTAGAPNVASIPLSS